MQLTNLLAVAHAEMRGTRRLARYWVFCVLMVLSAVSTYGQYASLHGFLSHASAAIGLMSPRYLISGMGFFMLALFLVGFVFLAFDVRGRDVRERMAEVLDAKPLSNAEFLVGRGMGLVFMAWLPIILTGLVLQGFGLLANLADWPVGEPFEPYSIIEFAIQCATVFVFWCALIILITCLVGNRLVVAVVAFVLLGAQFWMSTQMPLYLQSIVGLAPVSIPSDIVPSFMQAEIYVPRIATWIVAAGFIGFAVALHPRRDDAGKGKMLGIGAALALVAAAIFGWHVNGLGGDIARDEALRTLHEARATEARADLIAVRGVLRIDPGDEMHLDVELTLANDEPMALESLLLTLNPGLAIKSLTVDGRDAGWRFEDGLLDVEAGLSVGATAVLALTAAGTPDTSFGYLDTAIKVETNTAADSQLTILGTEGGIFSSRHVALMPGLRWLPHPGTDVSADASPGTNVRYRPSDFFTLDLEVVLPEDWLVAGPGRRETLGNGADDTVRYRFHPANPVPEVGLIAGPFARHAMEVRGVEFELLMHPGHRRNIDFFAGIGDELEARLAELLREAEDLGLAYPYNGFSLVEVPITLRGYGGGWRMDTVLALPGMMLVREASFPTARFDGQFADAAEFENVEGGIERAKLRALGDFFFNDFSGGNVFLGASRSLFLFQTGARDTGAVAIDFVLGELVNYLLTERFGYFSVFEVNNNATIQRTVQSVTRAVQSGGSVMGYLLDDVAGRSSTWDRALSEPLSQLRANEDPRSSINVLVLKGQAIARAIIDGIGRDKTAALLAELLTRHRGGHFTAQQLGEAAVRVGADLRPILGDWLEDTQLPGFIASPVMIERLDEDARGLPRYQIRLHVRNDEAAPGLLRIEYATRHPGDKEDVWHSTEPERLGGKTSVEFGLLSSSAPVEMRLSPYLSLNRQHVRLPLPRVDTEQRSDAEPFVGVRPSDWLPRDAVGGDIVVDDLDPGFGVEDDVPFERGEANTLFMPSVEIEMDQGLPVDPRMFGIPTEWSRLTSSNSNAWGKYRHTMVWVRAGEGERRAIFEASIPTPGRWQLAYHIPERRRNAPVQRIFPGTQNMQLLIGDEPRELEFDAKAALPGWNVLGDFRLEPGTTQLVVSDVTTGEFVLVDAIRWRPL